MRSAKRLAPATTAVVWAVGARVPHWLRRAICRIGPWLVCAHPPSSVLQWEKNFRVAMGRLPVASERRAVISSWLRNNLMSLSLARWSDEDVLRCAIVSEADVAKLHESLAGPGLVLALPHMGSWDFAGAWCSRVGLKVLSVAERLPHGAYERFRDARAGMGMDILPVGQPDLMRSLVDGVRKGSAVCLLSDRDLSGRGVTVPWPSTDAVVHVPAGPAMVARLTGCDLRVASTVFRGDRVEIFVSDVIAIDTPTVMMTEAVAGFAAAVRADPTSWLMMQPLFKES